VEEKIQWYENELYVEDGRRKTFAVARYMNKLMAVSVDFMAGGLEARLKAMITDVKIEGEKREIEYFYNKMYVGMGEEFVEKMLGRMEFKRVELEMITTGEDD